MSISDDYLQELSTLIKETGERLIEDHYPQFCDALGEATCSRGWWEAKMETLAQGS